MRLIYEKTGVEVKIGDTVEVGGGKATIERIDKPWKPSSTGRVGVRYPGGSLSYREYFPNVVGAKWVEREDQL